VDELPSDQRAKTHKEATRNRSADFPAPTVISKDMGNVETVRNNAEK